MQCRVNTSHLFILTILVFGLFFSPQAQALDKTFDFTPFATTSPEELQGNTLKSDNLSTGNIPSAMGAQTLFFIPADPSTVAHKLLSWDASSHKDLGILKHITFKAPATKSTFDPLNLTPDRAEDKWFIEASCTIKDIYITSSDLSLLKSISGKQSNPNAIEDVWKQILSSKNSSYISSGVKNFPPYQIRDSKFSPYTELKRFLNNNPSISNRFQSLLDAIFSGNTSIGETTHYWEKLKIDRELALNLAVTQAIENNGSWQVADYQYFVTSNYYTSMILYQISPATVGGQKGSIIWRADFILTPGMENSRGVERMFGIKVLIQEIRKSVEYLRGDISK